MILSASRRTDIPNYYSRWFFNRIKEGYLYVRNPFNPHQVSRIGLSPQTVDCIVFWTKNPAPMMERLEELDGYPYYVQFTLTGYGRDIEPGLPDKRKVLIPTFRKLSEQIGRERVVWRYDPILLNGTYTMEYHQKAFREIAESLRDHTERVVISFLDFYARTRRNMGGLEPVEPDQGRMRFLAGALAEIARQNHLQIKTCAEKTGLEDLGIAHGSCIDKALVERIMGHELKVGKDKNQRPECGCAASVDIGTYNTCRNGCRYCYANFNGERVRKLAGFYDADGPMLCGTLQPGDRVTERKI